MSKGAEQRSNGGGARQTDFCAYLSAIAGWSRPSMRVLGWWWAEPGCSVDYSSYRRERNLRGSELANSGQMYKRSLVRISDTMTENFMSDGGNISLAENQKADHVCDGVPFRPFEIYVWQSAS